MMNKRIEWQFGPVVGLAIMWEKVDKHQWILDFILPGVALTVRIGKGWK